MKLKIKYIFMEFLFINFYNTALHFAVRKKNIEIIKLLLNQKGINDQIKNKVNVFI